MMTRLEAYDAVDDAILEEEAYLLASETVSPNSPEFEALQDSFLEVLRESLVDIYVKIGKK